MKCSIKDCRENSRDILAVIDDGKKRMVFCPVHQIHYATTNLCAIELYTYPSLAEGYRCEICGSSAFLYADEVELHLCHTHLKKLLKRCLSSSEFKILYHRYGIFNLIYEDFYTETGYAMQPIYE